ncbi:transcriptional regulator [Polaribacter sp. MSW13]|uniref:Transcriptional regulator n=1 Tax=Polaribacter marinus TaxID=2916838 RepID=A0A9X1VQF9_9FLAO|nr:P-II family nitrogen regulator [Polaribacter marinus]MCI2230373.1 transcriptional regulator [Polaribacter marinus]
MKKIEAIIRASKFNELRKALHEVDVNYFSYWDVTTLGNKNENKSHSSEDYNDNNNQKKHLSIVVNDAFEEVTIKTILSIASTKNEGDGKIFVSEINQAYLISSGKKGEETLNYI